MHKHFLIALIAGAGALLTACSEDGNTVRQRTLEVVSSDTNFPVDGGQRTVTLAPRPQPPPTPKTNGRRCVSKTAK